LGSDAPAWRWRTCRTGALLTTGSSVLHAFTLSHAAPIVAVGMAAMIVACLFCAYGLWIQDTLRDWVRVGVMNIVMIGVHLRMTGGDHHHGSVSVVVAPASGAAAMAAATGVAILEVALAVAVLLYRTRRYPAQLVEVANGEA
jgi:hypothetical protein